MKPKRITIPIEPTTRTDLICLVCGSFRSEFAVGRESEANAGIHKHCIKALRKWRS